MSIICENCKAPYAGPVSPYSKFVKCPYCNCAIKISKDDKTKSKNTVSGTSIQDFNLNMFEEYLNKRGYRCFDPISGIVKLRNQEVIVSSDGSVTGTNPLKSRVEKWINDFMSEDSS